MIDMFPFIDMHKLIEILYNKPSAFIRTFNWQEDCSILVTDDSRYWVTPEQIRYFQRVGVVKYPYLHWRLSFPNLSSMLKVNFDYLYRHNSLRNEIASHWLDTARTLDNLAKSGTLVIKATLSDILYTDFTRIEPDFLERVFPVSYILKKRSGGFYQVCYKDL